MSASFKYGVGAFLVGSGLAWLFCFVTCEKCGDPVTPRIDIVAFYDADNISAMLAPTEAAGIRFYLALNAAGAMTVAAGTVQADGTHIPLSGTDVEFRMFRELSGASTSMDELKVDEAQRQVLAAGTADKPTWSIDVSAASLRNLLAVSGCNGIGIMERNTTTDDWTFDVVPVELRDGGFTPVGEIRDMRVGAPCPMHCPRDPAAYLHRS